MIIYLEMKNNLTIFETYYVIIKDRIKKYFNAIKHYIMKFLFNILYRAEV